MFSGIVTSMDELAGMETRRMLRAGEIVRVDDVRHPILVTKGSIVTMTFEAPGVVLTASGRAMSEGGMGDTVTVQNPVSFRMITATVTGAGAVRAPSGAVRHFSWRTSSPPQTIEGAVHVPLILHKALLAATAISALSACTAIDRVAKSATRRSWPASAIPIRP